MEEFEIKYKVQPLLYFYKKGNPRNYLPNESKVLRGSQHKLMPLFSVWSTRTDRLKI